MPSRRTLAKWLCTRVALDADRPPMVEHVFTHRIWKLSPVRVRAAERPCPQDVTDEQIAWIAPGERPNGGIPSVTEKLLRAVGHG